MELDDVSWDVVVITETWREEVSESFVLPPGHQFCGSGGDRGRCGIGFLVHKRWSAHHFVPISPRLSFLDIRFQSCKCRIFGLYMPQTNCPDSEVYELYSCIERNFRANMHTLVCGDFNAHVG